MTQNVWSTPNTANIPGPSATTINYQGRLADSSGNPLSGSYNLQFAIYDAPTGGSRIWAPENHLGVPVADGLFSVDLGSQTTGGIPTSTWNGDRYLEITVNGEPLTPRELIRSVPIAGMALTVPDGTITTDKIADGAVTIDKLSLPIFGLLGHKTCRRCGSPVEQSNTLWVPVKGENTSDVVEVTVTTQGGPIFVQMTAGFETNPSTSHFCGVRVLRNNSVIRFVHFNGNRVSTAGFSCSGTWLFPNLPSGTYKFQAEGHVGSTQVTWVRERQIVVYEFPPTQ